MKVHTRRRRAGFSLTEMLVVVGIIAILLGVAVPSILYYQRELKLTELDDNARAVFVAAQNHLTALRSASAGELEVSEAVGRPAQSAPDAVKATAGAELLYVSTDVTGAEPGWLILPGAIESELAEGCYLVEFEPKSGSVYGVFFLERNATRTLNESTYQTIHQYTSGGETCRTRAGRKALSKASGGFYVGYYGADGALDMDRPDAQTLPQPKLKLINAEELRLEIEPDQPVSSGKVYASVSVSDGANTKTLIKEGAITGKVTMVLDSLKSYPNRNEFQNSTWANVGGSFAQWVDNGSGGYVIAPGSDITVTVTLFYKPDAGESVAALPQSAAVSTNSLFAARSGATVQVAYGRHLQNLGQSDLDSTITAAKQTRAIDFGQAGGGIYSWEDTYGHAARPFVPITNANLDSYSGGALAIKNLNAVDGASGGYENAGLFGVFSGRTLEDIVLVDAQAAGTNAGALAGKVHNAAGQDVTVRGCQVYLDRPTSATRRVRGSACAGGLVGRAETKCILQGGSFASTVVHGATTGGLVGLADSGVTVQESYAAGRLSGGSVGGLVGRGSAIRIENCYAAGMIVRASTAAGGLSAGAASVQNAYAAVDYVEKPEEGAVYYGAVASGSQGKVYYLVKSGFNDAQTVANVTPVTSPKQMATPADLGLSAQRFTLGENAVTEPYNMSDQPDGSPRDPKLAAPYPYPALNVDGTAVPHYGDWLEGSALRGVVAYYEQYQTNGGLQTDFFYYELNDAGTLETKGALNATGSLYSDGYAFLSLNQLHEDGQSVVPMKVAIGAGAEMREYSTLYLGTYVDGPVTYYAYGLPNAALDGAVAAEEYFLQLRVAGLDSSAELSSLWLNPHFGRAAYNGYGETNPGASTVHKIPIPSATAGDIAIRSVRQFNNMRKYKSAIRSWVQELDMDASVYQGHQTVDEAGYLTVGGLRVTARSGGTWAPVQGTALPGDYRLAMTPITMTSPSKGLTKDTWGGTYNGQGHSISGLSIGSVTGVGANNQSRYYAGLFCCLSSSGAVENVTLTRCDVTGLSGSKDHYTGALAGYTEGTIRNCTVTNTSVNAVQQGSTENGYIGGLVGFVRKGTVESCGVHLEGNDLDGLYVTCAVTGAGEVGGLTGQIKEGNVRDCHAAVKVSGRTAGGLVGAMAGGTVADSYAGGHTNNGVYLASLPNVTGTANAGGFAGLWSSGALEGLCYTTCAVSGDKKADVFAVATGASVPTGCYAGGDVFVGGSKVTVSEHNSAKAITGTLPAEAEATQAAAHPYDPTLPDKYPYKPVTNAAGAPVDHYGDWRKSNGSGHREWEQSLPKSEEEALSNLTANATWTDKELTLDILIDVPGNGYNQDLHNAPGKPTETEWGTVNQGVNGIYCITTDLGYKFIFRVNADGTIDSLAGDKLKVERVDLGIQEDGNRDIRWTISIPNEFIPPYVDHISFGSMIGDDYTLTNIKNNNKGLEHLGDDKTITIDGDFSDWLGYEHQVLEGRPAGSDTPVYGHTTGSILGTKEDIFFHLISDNANHWPAPYEGMSFDRLFVLVNGEMRTWNKDGTEIPCSWWNAFRTLTYHEGQSKYTVTFNCPCQQTVTNEWGSWTQWATQPIDVAELYVSFDPETKHQEYEMRIDLKAWMTINLYENKVLDDLDAALKDGAQAATQIDKVKWKWYGGTVELVATRDVKETE